MSMLVTGGSLEARSQKIQEILKLDYPQNELQTGEGKGISDVFSWQTFLNRTGRKPRVLLISRANSLSIEAQNALLKILEEPPTNTQIILEAISEETLLPTIVSRCLPIELPPQRTGVSAEIANDIETLNGKSTASLFNLSARVASDRTGATAWLDSVISALHQGLITGEPVGKKITLLLAAKKQILANCNTRLALENAFLKW